MTLFFLNQKRVAYYQLYNTLYISGVDVPVVRLGGPAYSANMVEKPYSNLIGLTREQRCFNYYLGHARVVVESALLADSRAVGDVFSNHTDTHLAFMPTIIVTAFVSCISLIIYANPVHGDEFN